MTNALNDLLVLIELIGVQMMEGCRIGDSPVRARKIDRCHHVQLEIAAKKVEKGKNPEPCDEALNTALYSGHNYLICPSILQWEDYTGQIEIRDKLTIEIIVIDTLTGVKIDTVIINGKSRPLPSGTEKPQDLLATPIRAYVDSLFQ